MKLFKFIFSFLYVRDWHTGVRELSPGRTAIFVGGIALIIIVVLLGLWLQMPAEYQAESAFGQPGALSNHVC